MEKKKGYYIVDGDYQKVPEEGKEKAYFFMNRFFTGVVMWFLPWAMIALASITAFHKFGFICYFLTALFFFESFYLYHILRETKNGQGYFFVFSIVVILLFACLI